MVEYQVKRIKEKLANELKRQFDTLKLKEKEAQFKKEQEALKLKNQQEVSAMQAKAAKEKSIFEANQVRMQTESNERLAAM